MEAGKIKRKKGPKFTIVSNEIIHDPNLSWKAKGLMSYLVSLPDEWEIFKTELVKRSKDGYESMLSGWKELESAGYISTRKIKNGNLFVGYEYTINEHPSRGQVFTEPENRESENTELIYTNSKSSTSRRTNSNLNLNAEFENSAVEDKTLPVKAKEKKKEESAHHRIIKHFFEVMHPDFSFGPIHAKSVKYLLNNIKQRFVKSGRNAEDEKELGDFAITLLDNLPVYYLDKDLATINSKFNEIITEIKNKVNGKSNSRKTAVERTKESVRNKFGSRNSPAS